MKRNTHWPIFRQVFIFLFAGLFFSSCSPMQYLLFDKKYSYYKDYPDNTKNTYFLENKSVIDSLLTLASDTSFTNFIAFKKDGPLHSHINFITIQDHFFDTTAYGYDKDWKWYHNINTQDSGQLDKIIREMIRLCGQIHPLFPGQFTTNHIRVSAHALYIPLKKIMHDNYTGDNEYGYLILFTPGITNAAVAGTLLNVQVRIVGPGLATNEILKK